MSFDQIRLDKHEGIALLTLHRPDRMNAFTTEMMLEIVAALDECDADDGVRAVIFRSPCIAVTKPSVPFAVDGNTCIGCKKCIRELGCPALVNAGKKVSVEKEMCFGCGLCAKICPTGAIRREEASR